MRRLSLLALSLGLLMPPLIASAPAHAQATRTWISGVGDDVNPCSRTAPCKTFAGAISKTAARGEINCLDSGGFGAVTIAKEITIDCTGVNAGILNAGTNGVIVNIAGGAVTLRNLTIDGAGSGLNGVRILAASKVNLENVEIFSNTQKGVSDERTTAGNILVIQNSIIRNNAGAGIGVAGSSSSGVLLENVVSKQNQFGIALGNGLIGIIARSSFSNNVTAGVEADAGGSNFVTDSLIAFNGTGISGTATMANTSIVSNTTGISGSVTSFGNNRIFGNTSAGSVPLAAGAASSDLGQK